MADGHEHFLHRMARGARAGWRRQVRGGGADRWRRLAGRVRQVPWRRAARGALERIGPLSDRGGGFGAGAAARQGGRSRRRRVVRGLAFGLSALVLATATAGAVVYLRLNGNLRDLPLFGGVGGDAGHERPDAFGRTPVNVLVIGSDARDDPADCRIGGDCGPGRNADVEMLLHLSADRSHGVVLSIPRDTVTDLPACRRPHGGIAPGRRGPVNSTLRYGPGCTVAAVHTLTGLPIDHFVMADFAGVVRLSDAVGGVPVCVDRNVYDPYAHLKLARGEHALKGAAALAFLRSRHAFGDGSDLGRTAAQHLYLASLFRRMRAGGSLSDPAGMLSLADAATQALTVDPGLASVDRLAALADDARKVPTARLVFTTMPTEPDPFDRNRLVPARSADRLFAAIASDRPVRVAYDARAADGKAGDGPGPAGRAVEPAGAAQAAPEIGDSRDDRPLPAARRATPAPAPVASGSTAASGGTCVEVATGPAVVVGGVAMTPSAAFAATPRVPVSAP